MTARMIRRTLEIGSGPLLGAALLVGGGPQAVAAQAEVVIRVPITGTIELGLAPFVERSIGVAEARGAAALILDINTPGGRVDAAERIADAIGRTEIPVYAFINPRAYSAGALIALAADGIYMPPGAVMGAVTPVDGTGEKAPEKIVSAMRSQMRALAEARGLDPAIAEAMVDESLEVPGVIEAGRLLTLTSTEAVRLDYATATEGFDGLLADIGAPSAGVVDMEVNWAERVVRFFSHPLVSPFLLSLGFLGILVEIKSPGLGMAGAAGVIALGLFFGSHALVGLAGWEDLIFFVIGAGLLAIEIFLVPGFGVFGVLGIMGMAIGIFLSLMGDSSYITMDELTRAGLVLTTSIMIIAVSTWALMRHFLRSGGFARSGIVLAEATSREAGYESAVRRTDLIGKEGVALTDLRPSGVALVDEERIDVVSEAEWVAQGTRVRVLRAEGYRHVVRPLS